MGNRRGAYLRLVLLGLVWGTSFLFISYALEGLTPAQVAFGRVLLGAAVMWPLARAQGHRPSRDPRLWGHVAVISVVATVLPFLAFAWGQQQRVTSGLAGIYNALTPLATLLVAVAVLPDERPTLERVLGFLTAVGGVVSGVSAL